MKTKIDKSTKKSTEKSAVGKAMSVVAENPNRNRRHAYLHGFMDTMGGLELDLKQDIKQMSHPELIEYLNGYNTGIIDSKQWKDSLGERAVNLIRILGIAWFELRKQEIEIRTKKTKGVARGRNLNEKTELKSRSVPSQSTTKQK